MTTTMLGLECPQCNVAMALDQWKEGQGFKERTGELMIDWDRHNMDKADWYGYRLMHSVVEGNICTFVYECTDCGVTWTEPGAK